MDHTYDGSTPQSLGVYWLCHLGLCTCTRACLHNDEITYNTFLGTYPPALSGTWLYSCSTLLPQGSFDNRWWQSWWRSIIPRIKLKLFTMTFRTTMLYSLVTRCISSPPTLPLEALLPPVRGLLVGHGHSGLHLPCCCWGWLPPSLHSGLHSNAISQTLKHCPLFHHSVSPTLRFLFGALIII